MKERTLSRCARGACAALAWLALGLLAAGCSGLSYPEQPEPADGPQAALSSASPERRAWIAHSRSGREALRLHQYEAAEDGFLAAISATGGLPPSDARAQAALGNLIRLAGAYQQQQRFEDAARVTAHVVSESRAGPRPYFEAAAPVLLRQGQYLEAGGRAADAAALYEFALGLEGAHGDAGSTSERLELRRHLANAYVAEGRLAEAAPLLEALQSEIEARHGAASPHTARMLEDVARLHWAERDLQATERAYLRAIEIYAADPARDYELLRLRSALASVYLDAERPEDAERLGAEVLALLEEGGTEGGPLAAVLDTLATAEARIGKHEEAEAHYRRGIEERDKETDPAVTRHLRPLLQNYADLLRSTGRTSEADAIEARIALEIGRDGS